MRVYHPNASRFPLRLVVDDRVHHGVGTNREISGLCRPRERRRIRAEVASVGAPTHTQIARLTGTASLLQMDLSRPREMRPPPLNHVAVAVMRAHAVAEMLLDAVEVEWR